MVKLNTLNNQEIVCGLVEMAWKLRDAGCDNQPMNSFHTAHGPRQVDTR